MARHNPAQAQRPTRAHNKPNPVRHGQSDISLQPSQLKRIQLLF